MAPLNFPTAPTNGQKYPATPAAGGHQWEWDGAKWMLAGTAAAAPLSADDPEHAAALTVTGSINDAGTLTTVNGKQYRYWEFHADGSVTVTKEGVVSAFIVGAGGSSQSGPAGSDVGGAGGGGVLIVGGAIIRPGKHTVHIGQHKKAYADAALGHPSSFGSFTALGGGVADLYGTRTPSATTSFGKAGTLPFPVGQGFAGADGGANKGGGGAGGPAVGANGGPGVDLSTFIGGPARFVGGGGAGSGGTATGGGGVYNASGTVSGTNADGAPNTGGGAGGRHGDRNNEPRPFAMGGTGLVIIRVAV